MARVNARLRVQNDDTLDQVAQLAYVARPVVLLQHLIGRRRQLLGLAAVRHGELAQKVIRQQRDILNTVTQGRHMKRDHIEPVEQILAEITAFNFVLQHLVGRGDHAHVHLRPFGRAHGLEALFFERAQHLGLRAKAHVAHFVQE